MVDKFSLSSLTLGFLSSATERWHQSPLGCFFARFVEDFPEVGRLPFRQAKEEATVVWRTMSTVGRTPFVRKSAAVKEEARRAKRAAEELRRVKQIEAERRRQRARDEAELKRIQERVARTLYYEHQGSGASSWTSPALVKSCGSAPKDPRSARSPPRGASSLPGRSTCDNRFNV